MRGWLVVSAAVVMLAGAVSARSAQDRDVAGATARAPERLEDTGLYAADDPGRVDPRNRAFSPQYPLWSDGATKSRWVFLPPGSVIDAADPHAWDLPVGTRFWKEFRFGGRKIETRFLWKASAGHWVAASYIWNAGGTAATRAPDAGEPGVVEIAPGRWHAVPSVEDCRACHGSTRTRPLGFNALQLSTDRDPHALHGEPSSPDLLTLKSLVEERRLSPASQELVSDPPRIRASHPQTRAVLGYLAANCGSCHDGSGEISVQGLSLKHRELTTDGDAVARRLIGFPTAWQVPSAPTGASVLVNLHAPGLSAILARMRSRLPSSQMPPLGTVVRDQAAVEAVATWIGMDLKRLQHPIEMHGR